MVSSGPPDTVHAASGMHTTASAMTTRRRARRENTGRRRVRAAIAEARNVELHHRPTDAPLPPATASGSVGAPFRRGTEPRGRLTTGVPELVEQGTTEVALGR